MKNKAKFRILSLVMVLLVTCGFGCFEASAKDQTMDVSVYMSNSFLTKNGVPDAFTSYLSNAFKKPKFVFDAIADINLLYNFTANSSRIISINPDNCNYTKGSNYLSNCKCVTNSGCRNNTTLHHTNFTYIHSNSIPSGSTTTTVPMLLTANKLCKVNSDSTHGYIYGVAYTGSHNIMITDTDVTDIVNGNEIEYSLLSMDIVHEIGHLYEVNHHYTDATADQNCIWGTNRHSYNVVNNLKICSRCLQIIRQHSSKYSQSDQRRTTHEKGSGIFFELNAVKLMRSIGKLFRK